VAQAVPPLLLLVRDPDMQVQLEAALALGQVSGLDNTAIEPLLDAMKTDWYSVRFAASVVLKKVTGQDLGPDFEKWSVWWAQNKDKRRSHSLS
jgi:HEAT repeat protein